MDPPQKRSGTMNYGMSLTNQLNMTNCYKHCKHFFDNQDRSEGIHFNVLIAYWMMAGYLGPFDSIQEAYKRGHKILLDLTCGENSMLKNSDQEPEMIEFKTSDSESLVCSGHKGLCDMETLGFGDLVDLAGLEDFVVPADGMLKSVPRVSEESLVSGEATIQQPKQSMLLIHGRNLSRQVFHTPRKLRYVAYFDPMPESLNLLLNNVTKQLSVLLLRGCNLLREIDIPLEKFSRLTVLEISGLSQVQNTDSLLQKISELSQLRCLHLSDLLVTELPERFFDRLLDLRWIILRGCSRLLNLPSVKSLPHLNMLDVSYCSALLRSSTAILLNPELQVLDFSQTPMTTLPNPQKTQLSHMIARNAKVSVLSFLNQVSSLEVVDLSGAEKVKRIQQLRGNKNLTVLNLSRTNIETIHFLPELVHLHDLVLHGCAVLKELSSVVNLTKLEVFDISGCICLEILPEGLEELKSLKELNLSSTSVSHLPSFAKLTNLVKLSLRGLKVVSLGGLQSLSKLEELDLNSLQIIPPQELKLDFLQHLVKLQILDLSHTLIADIPNLVSLKQLLLANCQQLKAVPNIQHLTNLEILDLSLQDPSTINNEETDYEVPSTCRKLVLRNRSGKKWLLPLTSLGELGYLDLRGTDVDRIPFGKMAQMSCVLLPAKIALSGVHLSRMGVKEEIDWKVENPGHLQGKFSDPSGIQIVFGNGNKASMSTQGSQFFRLSEKASQDSKYWEAFIHQISVSLHSDGIIYLDGDDFVLRDNRSDDFVLRDNRSWFRRLLNLDLKGRSIEIHGFSKLPEIRKDLDLVDNVALVGNTFQVRLKDENDVASVSNELPDSHFIICSKTMKVCCIRNCQEMEAVLTTEEEKNGVIAGNLERLVLSNLVKLKTICAKSVSSKTISFLKHLHIDCCPELKSVIIASQVPENLESLHVKFCDKMNSLFEQNISLNCLLKLTLFELPELESIEAKLPKLETLIISQCPKLKSLDGVIESASVTLTYLYLDSLPCLVTLFANSASSSSSEKYNLKTLKRHNLTLKLHNLPKLESRSRIMLEHRFSGQLSGGQRSSDLPD